MSSVPEKRRCSRRAGFTLIELIGVLAIMAIIAGAVAPNVLRSIESASAKAEATYVANLVDEIKAYTRDTGAMPASATWTTAIARYSQMGALDLAQNKRQRPRVLLTDPTTNRVIILSVMSANSNLTLPNPNTVNATAFGQIWNTVDSTRSPSNWAPAVWNGWTGVAGSEQWLVIQRINLLPELQTFQISLINNGSSTLSVDVLKADGSLDFSSTVGPGVPLTPPLPLRAQQRLNLYNATGILNYTYVVSTTGKTFEFNGTNWIPQ